MKQALLDQERSEVFTAVW